MENFSDRTGRLQAIKFSFQYTDFWRKNPFLHQIFKFPKKEHIVYSTSLSTIKKVDPP